MKRLLYSKYKRKLELSYVNQVSHKNANWRAESSF